LKNRWIYVLAVIFGLLTCYFIYDFLVSVEKKMTEGETQEVVIVVQDVASKTLLTKEMLAVKKVVADYIHPQALRKTEEAIGSITLTALVKGEQLLKSKIVKKDDTTKGLAYLIPHGKRAVSIAVDDVSGVAGLLKPGDKVDVTAVIGIPDSAGKEVPHSLVVLQEITVLAVGKNLEEKTGKGDNSKEEDKTVTLAVTVEEARPLLLASQKGALRLLLRSPVDSSTVKTNPFKAEDYLIEGVR
jgi:pilus assembly protein CpaB